MTDTGMPMSVRLIGDVGIDLHCPHCGSPMAKVLSGHFQMLETGVDEYFLRDGDLIQVVYEDLQQSGRGIGHGSHYELWIGSHPGCGRDYYVIELRLTAAAVDSETVLEGEMLEPQFVVECQATDVSVPEPGIPTRWLLTRHAHSYGPLHVHVFGPFALAEDDELEGPHGVCACMAEGGAWAHGRRLVLALWDDLMALARADRAQGHLALLTGRQS